MQNHFELFHLPQQFSVDLALLDSAYREVQGQVHPDRFVNTGSAERRVAMQWATRANEAYQVLKNPLKRAQYLCELHGLDLQSESNTAMPVAFLMQQMEWREALEEARAARDLAALEALERQLQIGRAEQLDEIAKWLENKDFTQAVQAVRSLMFLEKFAEEVGFAFEALDA